MLIPNKHSGYRAGIRLYPGGGKGGSSAPPPDPALIAAQIRSMGIQDSAITTMLQNSETLMPMQMEQMRFGIDSSRQAYNQSQDDRTWMLNRRGSLSGLQDTLVADAASFNTEDRRNELAGEATADVNSAFSSAREQQARGLSRMGVNPSSGRALAMGNQMSIAQAAAQSAASSKVRAAARAEGYSLTDRASNALAGYPAMGMQATGAGAGFGSSGLGLANSGLAGMNSGLASAGGMAGQMGQNATGMYGAQANYKNSQDQIASQQQDPFGAILGQGLGAAATAYGTKLGSDRRLKTDIERVGTLDNGLPVYRYRYKAGGPHMLGVMADEVEQVLPQAVHKQVIDGEFDAVDYAML